MKNHKMYMRVIYMKMQKIVSQFILGGFLACVWERTLVIQLNNFFKQAFWSQVSKLVFPARCKGDGCSLIFYGGSRTKAANLNSRKEQNSAK